MATLLTPQRSNQSAKRCRSPVKVPKLRTGSGALSGATAATCSVAPMSIAAAWGVNRGQLTLLAGSLRFRHGMSSGLADQEVILDHAVALQVGGIGDQRRQFRAQLVGQQAGPAAARAVT